MFGGIQKTTLIDYPGKTACVLFVSGCNFRCPYCHNPGLAENRPDFPIGATEVFALLDGRRGFLDGVVISGGEPTLRPDLVRLCENIKGMGYAVKLDTNGSRPAALRGLIDRGLVDYLAMDVKTDSRRYGELTREDTAAARAAESAAVILASGLPHEFRTTCVAPLVDEAAVRQITGLIRGARLYVLQRFVARNVLDPLYFEADGRPVAESNLERWQALAEGRGIRCIIR